MTSHHKHPTYVRNARIIRTATNQRLKSGIAVQCIGCGGPITPEQRFDVGHRIDASRGGSHDLDNLGPQHRRENRSAGGRIGALHTNAQSRRARGLPTW
ncbi:DNA/RNA non-specific endonuclease [Microbacterium allomyrinae]|uniref:HNH endonuclease n=1 Tax=Microbacterium allomyrinae TaxID=2830666 RepID=A0A9X1S2M9_9MICO|nr:DNA/RNA non-specific endonuclease [Microbacterium allomyrinae]MCC2032189.1 hypothetical protein [Microbacterium allomyrinae]